MPETRDRLAVWRLASLSPFLFLHISFHFLSLFLYLAYATDFRSLTYLLTVILHGSQFSRAILKKHVHTSSLLFSHALSCLILLSFFPSLSLFLVVVWCFSLRALHLFNRAAKLPLLAVAFCAASILSGEEESMSEINYKCKFLVKRVSSLTDFFPSLSYASHRWPSASALG